MVTELQLIFIIETHSPKKEGGFMIHGDQTDLRLREKFCSIHKELSNIGVAENSCDCCVMDTLIAQGLPLSDPENVTLYPGGNLGILIRMIGMERWQAIRDDPAEIKAMLERIGFFEKVGPSHWVPPDYPCPDDDWLNVTF
jgi:hypothetical protein